jgi:orotidine-5'-phosphate decarboxylase
MIKLHDKLALWINTACIENAIAMARDMRACTHTAVLGPSFMTANGPHGLRCIYELGVSDVFLNLGFTGTSSEVWECTMAAAVHGVKAVSVSALAGQANIRYAVAAAAASCKETLRAAPHVLVSLLPYELTDGVMSQQLRMRVRRAGHVAQAARLALDAGAAGLVVEHDDIKAVHRVSRNIPYYVYVRRRVRNYAERPSDDDKNKAGITEVLRAGASLAILDSTLLRRTDIDWAADMVAKELQNLEKE